MGGPQNYNAPGKQSAPFRMGKTPFDPRTGTFLPLNKYQIVQELTIIGECIEGTNKDDCLICENAKGRTIYVAKPFMLQRTPFDTQEFDGVTHAYTTATERTATTGSDVISQEITPSYTVDGTEKIIVALVLKPTMQVGKRKVEWMDVNTAGRNWEDAGSGGLWIQITGHSTDSTNRYTYTFVEVEKTSAGYGGWTTKSGGQTGTARNTIEDMNDAAGMQGCGVTVANLDTADYTYTITPCPTGNIILARRVKISDTTEYWFSHANGVDGTCD